MKTKAFTLFALLLFFYTHLSSQSAWTQLNVNNLMSYQGIYFLTDDMGWLAGDQGGFYHTIDGGESWSQIIVADDLYVDVSTSFSADMWLLSSYGSVYKSLSSTGYATWNLMYTIPGNLSFHSIQTNNLNHMFVLGQQVWRTTDEGESFVQVDVPSSYYSEMGFLSNMCILIGTGGAILKSTDNGETWTPITSTTINTCDLYSLQLIDFDTWIIIGAGGKIFRTVNGGASFELIESNTSLGLNDIKMISTEVFMIVGDAGTILKSTDGGLTWIPNNSGTYPLYSIALAQSSMIQYVCGYNGRVIKTESQGETPVLNLSATTLDFLANENLVTDFDIDANTLWRISCNDTWFSCNFNNGQNNSTIDVSVDANTLPTSRTGTITVTGSGITRTITVSQNAAASVEDLSKYGISIYPNPTDDKLYIESVPYNLNQISLIDISGKCHLQINADEIGDCIDLSMFTSGMYFIVFDIDDKQAFGKIIIR